MNPTLKIAKKSTWCTVSAGPESYYRREDSRTDKTLDMFRMAIPEAQREQL